MDDRNGSNLSDDAGLGTLQTQVRRLLLTIV
jgi:hypothetical protein